MSKPDLLLGDCGSQWLDTLETTNKTHAAEISRLRELNSEFAAVCERVTNLGAGPSDIAIMNRLIGKAKEQA